MLRILYMLYLWLFVVPVFVVLTILTALTVIVGCLLGGERIFAYYPGMIWSWLTCHLALCPVKVKGRENIDRKKSYVFVANHQGAFESHLLQMRGLKPLFKGAFERVFNVASFTGTTIYNIFCKKITGLKYLFVRK